MSDDTATDARHPPRRPRLPGRRGSRARPTCRPSPMPLNMGPSHPAMHGTVRMVLEVEGEPISSADVQIGYLHRCFEKECEHATWTQVFPYTDRLNYVSPMLNNVGYAMAVEKLLGIDQAIPERAQYIRVIVGEVSRISDHLTCLGRQRDGARRVHRLPLRAQGARVAVRAARGGLRRAPDATATCASAASPTTCPTGFDAKLRDILARTRDRDVRHRASCSTATASSATAWTASASSRKDDAIAYGCTGPVCALDRRRLRRPQGPPVPGLRPLRLRRAGRLGRRQLRPLPRARRGDRSSRCASSSRRSSRSPPARSCSTIRASRCRPRARSTTRSRR